MWSWRKIVLISLTCGIIACINDELITYLSPHVPSAYAEQLRSLNDLMIVAITSIILYRRIRKQQQQLVLSEKQYRTLFESNPNPMWIFNQKSLAFIAVNDAAVEKYGYSQEEFLKMIITDIRPKDDHQQLKEIVKKNFGGLNDVGKWIHLHKSGKVFPVSITSHEVVFDGQYCKMVMATDISKQVEHEQQQQAAYLKEKELHEKLLANYQLLEKAEQENRLMGQVIDKINNLVLIVKEGGEISWVNRAFTDFTGFTRQEVIGKNPGELLYGPRTDMQVLQRLVETVQHKEFFSGELINYKKNGELYWTQVSITPIFDENGVFQFSISVETIITEKKIREQKILEQHAALQRIAWFNSHELRRPICSIIGLVSLLKDADDSNEKEHCLGALESCTKELDLMIRDINQKAERMQAL